MVDKEDNFNEFLKQKVEESRFEYNEAYWLKAEKLIENAQPNRKPFWFGFGWGVLSLAIISSVLAVILTNQNSSKSVQQANLVQAGMMQEVSAISKARAQTLANTTSLQETTIDDADASSFMHAEVETSMAINQTNQQQKALINQNQTGGKGKNMLSGNSGIQSNQAIGEDETDFKKMGNFSKARNLSVKKLPEVPVVIAEEEEEEDISETITIAAPVIINARATKTHKDIDVNIVAACENKNTHEWMYNLLAGVSDSRGFEGNTVTSSKIGFGYFGGFRLAYKLDKNWFVGVQPLIYSRGAVNTSIQTEKTAYDFGANADEFVVKNKALLFAELPISIGYRIQRHQISVGAGFEYLLNVKSDVKDFGTTDYTPNQWGYTDGFNRFGTIAMFNYAFNVYNEFWLTMMVQKGFTDLTKAEYFTTNSQDKNFNLRIGIQYQLNYQKKKGK